MYFNNHFNRAASPSDANDCLGIGRLSCTGVPQRLRAHTIAIACTIATVRDPAKGDPHER